MTAQKRIDWIDVAKGIGMICVILAHVEESYVKVPLYTFHMPLFFFLSGYLFSTKSSFKEFFLNKCRRILIPYFVLGAILIAFDIYWSCRSAIAGMPWVLNKDYARYDITSLFTQERFLTLWFIACLFWLSLLFYVLVRFIKSEKVRAIVVTVLTIAMLVYYNMGGGAWFWNIDVCFTALPFFYVGYLCRKTDFVNEKILKAKYKWIYFIGFLAADTVCLLLNLKVSGEGLEMFYNQYGFEPLTYISAFTGIFAILILAEKISCFPLRYIGKNSMLFYAWHQTMMIPLVNHFYKQTGWFQDFVLPMPVYFGRAILTTVIICIVLGLVNELLCRLKLGFLLGK